MRNMNEQDDLIVSTKQMLTETNFKQFEYEMAQSRQKDLEAQLDKLLGDTIDQREQIEQFEIQVKELKEENASLVERDIA